MKKALIILSAIALLGCNHAANKLAQTTDTVMLQNEQIVMEKDLFTLKKIDSLTYFSSQKRQSVSVEKMEEITDFEKVKELLNGVLLWGFVDDAGDIQYSNNGNVVHTIYFRNGEKYVAEYEQYFVAYYPQEDILLLEGGHASDISYNLTTGEQIEDVGNPQYILFSSTKKNRLNGYFGGQECSTYFIQQKKENQYKKMIQLDAEFEKLTGIWLCSINDNAFWSDDETLNIEISIPINGAVQKNIYYQIILKK